MMNQTYYDSQIKPVIREIGDCLESKPFGRLKVTGEKIESKWINVSRNQLEKILHVLNTEI